MQPYFYTCTQSTLTILFYLIIFPNMSAIKAGGALRNEVIKRSENYAGGLFPALGVDQITEVLSNIPDSTVIAFQASKDTVNTGNTTAPEDDIIVSDEDENAEDEPYNSDDELEEADESEEDRLEDDDDGLEEEDEGLEGEDDDLEGDESEGEYGEEGSFQADVRSLSDLPLSRLLKVRGDLQRIEQDEIAETRALGGANPTLAKIAKATRTALGASAAQYNRRYSPNHASNVFQSSAPTAPQRNLPSETKKAADSDDTKEVPPRRGGWHFDEEEEEGEFEEEHGWISSWPKGKKKKKGDIGSVFQMSVTFLAFLAFGGYLLCLIVQAVKGGGPTGPSGDGYRPPVSPMVLMMPARLGVRRPRPPNPGRRRRRKRRRRREASESTDRGIPWPAWDDPFNADDSGRLWPNVDLSKLQRVLFDLSRELAENGRISQ